MTAPRRRRAQPLGHEAMRRKLVATIRQLEAAVKAEGILVTDRYVQRQIHPAQKEIRQLQIQLMKLDRLYPPDAGKADALDDFLEDA